MTAVKNNLINLEAAVVQKSTEAPEATETKSVKKLGVLAETAQGYALVDENGEPRRLLSNFIIRVKKRIQSASHLTFIADVLQAGVVVEENVNIPAEIFNDLKVFKNFFQRWVFYGSVSNLNLLKQYLLEQTAVDADGVDYAGFHQHGGEIVYVDSNGSINGKNEPVPTICLINDQVSVQSGILEVEPILKEEMESLAPHLFAFNDPSRAIAILLSFLVHFIQARLWNLGFKSPHLEVTGESGSGKSETLDLLMNLFSISIKNSCAQVTKFSLMKHLSETNFFPFFGDEQKFVARLSYIADILKDILRSAYDHSVGSRGQKDQTVRQYPYRRLCCLFGEHSLMETALQERQIKVSLSKLTTLNPAQTESFMFLKNHSEHLGRFGKSLLLSALRLTDEEILQDRKEITANVEKAVAGKIKSSRIINNICALMHAYRLLQRVFTDLELTLPVSEPDAMKAVVSVVTSDTLDGTVETLSAVDNTLQSIDVMLLKQQGHLLECYDPGDPSNEKLSHVQISRYKPTMNDLHNSPKDFFICLDVTRLYPEFLEYYRRHDLSIEKLSERDFKNGLRKMPYFVSEGTVRFKDGCRRSFRLNLSVAKKRELELPFLYAIAGMKEEPADE